MKKTGWVLTVLLCAFLLFSASGKFQDFPNKAEMFEKMGLTDAVAHQVGIIEIIFTILFLLPWTSFLGAVLLTGYLGGAVFTHMRVGDSWLFPIIIGVLVWVSLGLRQPEVFRLAFGMLKKSAAEPPPSE